MAIESENVSNQVCSAKKQGRQNILLLFLSYIKVGNTGKVESHDYKEVGKAFSTNESAVRYLFQKAGSVDKVFMFVSDGVRKEMMYGKGEAAKPYLDEQGRHRTHVEYFIDSLRDIVAEDAFVQIVFDDCGNGDNTLGSALEMSDSIKAYVDSVSSDTEVVLHADFTGGLRSAMMAMMAVVRLMQYSGIKTGEMLYSNFQAKEVEESGYIYDLFDVVSGAEEFANFGSVNTIKRYFQQREIPDVLRRLLDAMGRFSEEIRLCHRKQLEMAAADLCMCIRDFAASDSKDIESRLMHQLETRIKRDFAGLWADDADIMSLIRWCLEHDYLQQALTLFVEGIPDYLYEHGIFQLPEDVAKRKFILEKKDKEVSTAFYLLTVFNGGKGYAPMSEAKTQVSNMQNRLPLLYKQLVKEIADGSTDAEAAVKCVEGEIGNISCALLEKPERMADFFHTLEKWRVNPLLLKNPADDDAWYLCFKERMQGALEKIPYGQGRYQKIVNFIGQMKGNELCSLVSDCQLDYAFRFLSFTREEVGLARVNIPLDAMRDILRVYGFFKNERNSSNHARLDADVITADDLKCKMLSGLQMIRSHVKEHEKIKASK